MKLQLKHITPYLPWELKVKAEGCNPTILEHDCCSWALDRGYKPILRPLSDLTERINFKGSEFVPEAYLYFEVIGVDNDMYGTFDEFKDNYLDHIKYNISHIPYCIITQLLEWHFNVFNLPKELFIDINTLNQ